MKPWAIRTEKHFASSSSFDRLNQIVKLPNSRCIRIHIRISRQLISYLLVRLPVVSKASKMRDNEVDVRIFGSEHVHHLWTANNVYEHWEAKCSGRFTCLASRHGFKAMNLNPPEAPACYRMPYHFENPAGITFCVDEGEANEAAWITSYDPRHLHVGLLVVAVQRRQHDRLVDSCCPGAPQVCFHRSICVPGGSHFVSLTGVAVAVDDHRTHSLSFLAELSGKFGRRNALAAALRYQIE